MEEYTKEYYQSINSLEKDQAKALSEVLTRLYSPESIADVGCGTGLYLEPFTINLKSGFELSEAAMLPEVRRVKDIFPFDLTEKHDTQYGYDLALCLEVLEHIGSENADMAVENLSLFAKTLVVTAAPPGQAGLNHVNCQTQSYWDEKFAERGYKRNYHDEYQIVSHLIKTPHTVWIIRNLMVYKK